MLMRGERVLKVTETGGTKEGFCLGLVIRRDGSVIAICETTDKEIFHAMPAAVERFAQK